MIPMEGYTAPGVEDFQFPGLFGTDWITKPMIQAIIAAIAVVIIWWLASRRLTTVPNKRQFLMEYLYDFIRNGVGRDILGPGFRPYIGLLVGLFTYILLNNWFGELFLFMFPTMSNIGYSWGAVVMVLFIYIYAGFRTHGPGYLKKALIPEGVPWYLYPIIVPVEFLSTFITRPLTLGVRLFANMFAGHLTIMVFVVGGTYLITQADGILLKIGGGFSIIFSFVMLGFELFIGFLQAYIFTILTAQYISSSISDSH
ncbi:F0F1 ATP synthase subunit A [Propionimicrobium sp. PCR01-08-3]|uniref:F0F1 ATP synthase subunit A n=1 Tax=Propionimicrobium sp. PCR01-08-3 TaxID=3052086 RepID=UPI00255C7FB7|nr:F0F1 ATP synthase subunit A [Propionimicrobium sp. PCR01-08-3]WIY83816.1 F0F1 ATP synthase subunit A [Propionimicrobium sp. PCR01-08-3]